MTITVQRLIAFAIDWIVLFVLLVLPQLVLAMALDTWILSYSSPPVASWAWVTLTVSLPSWVYFILCDSSVSGATFGKRILGLSAWDIRGKQISRARALLRNAVKLLPWEMTHIMIFFPEPFGEELTSAKITLMVIVDMLLIIWLVTPFLDRSQHGAIHDRVAKTCVDRLSRVARTKNQVAP